VSRFSLVPASLLLAPLFLLTSAHAQDSSQALDNVIQKQTPDLTAMYKDLHEHPELSHHEERTSAIVAKAFREAGYTVTDHVGIYPDGSRAFGVVGILKNGPGPTLLVRGDMDALPIVEETGVPYASHVVVKTASGQDTGVMHACGHDVHTTVLIGTARAMPPPNRSGAAR
jgi:metal-dependent amidase/aminoacylase/carboxypeptidase family protein